MDSFDTQLLAAIYKLLVSKPVEFVFLHSMLLGFFTGVISLVPFAVRRIPHVIVMLIASLALFYIGDFWELSLGQVMYVSMSNVVAKLVGNYIAGYIYGLALANLIQRIRGEHEHVN